MQYKLGDTVRMKKPHPCGANQWSVIRVGMDVKIRCGNCGRIVMLSREKFEAGCKQVLPCDSNG